MRSTHPAIHETTTNLEICYEGDMAHIAFMAAGQMIQALCQSAEAFEAQANLLSNINFNDPKVLQQLGQRQQIPLRRGE